MLHRVSKQSLLRGSKRSVSAAHSTIDTNSKYTTTTIYREGSISNNNNLSQRKSRIPSETFYNRNPVNNMFTKHVPKTAWAYFEIFYYDTELEPDNLIAQVKDQRGEVVFEINSKQIVEGTLHATHDQAASFLGEAVGHHCRNSGIVDPYFNRRSRPYRGRLNFFREGLKASLRVWGEVGRTRLMK